MSDDHPAPKSFVHLLKEMQKSEDLERKTVAAAGLEPDLAHLRYWQSQRLSGTYSDLLAQPNYRAACEFFLNDIYAARDFTQRDHDAERIYALLSKYLREEMLTLLADTITINHMTNHLDAQLLHVLTEQLDGVQALTPEMYAEGYRRCDNYAERKAQIELIGKILQEAASGARYAVVGISLKLARGAANKFGWGEVYDFLERGYQASRPMKDVAYFVNTVHDRELLILDKIYAGQDWLPDGVVFSGNWNKAAIDLSIED